MRLTEIYDRLDSEPRLWSEGAYRDLDWSIVPERHVSRVKLRLSAWRSFLEHRSAAQAAESLGVARSFMSKVLKLVYEINHAGEIAGLDALIPYTYRERGQRQLPLPDPHPEGYGYALAFAQLLDKEIEGETLGKKLENYILDCERQRPRFPSKPEVPTFHAYFKRLCRDIGLQSNQYPFCTDSVASRSISTFVREVRDRYYASKNFRTDNWRDVLGEDGRLRPFERTELDEHTCDQWPFAKTSGLEVVWTDGPHVRFLALERLVVVAEVDMASHVAMGFRLCERRRNNAEDVLDCLARGTVPWSRCEPNVPGLNYPDGPAFASEIGEALEYRGRACIKMDNDLTHYAIKTQRAVIEKFAAEAHYGKKATPQTRGHIEGLFDKIEDKLRNLPCFTGKFPGDERGKRLVEINPSDYLFIDQLGECIELALVEHNTTSNSGLGGMSPIEYLAHNHARDNILAYFQVPEPNIEACYIDTRIVTVRMHKSAPNVQAFGGRYYDPVLAQWVNKKLELRIDRRDGRHGDLYALSGEKLGRCTYKGPLQYRRHHVDERLCFLRWARTDRFKRDPDSLGFTNYIAEQAQLAKDSRMAAARLGQIQDRIETTNLDPPRQSVTTPIETTSEVDKTLSVQES